MKQSYMLAHADFVIELLNVCGLLGCWTNSNYTTNFWELGRYISTWKIKETNNRV